MNKEKKTRRKLIITMAISLILLVGITVSYGYIAILGKKQNQKVSISTGDIHLVFDDADSGSIEANLNLGGSITKTLKITNKGTKPGKVQINWKNLINTYNSRSLSYTLETSSSKDTGYTSVEALRENVPVSTEAKEVPLSKELTIPVGNNPIYYRVTITFNDLEDVDQSGDLSATLSTQFSLSEPENLSKKVIAVLNGTVKTSDPDLTGPAPRYEKAPVYSYMRPKEIKANEFESRYIYYDEDYKFLPNGKMYFINPQVAKYKDIYSSLIGKYIRSSALTTTLVDNSEINDYCYNLTTIYKVEAASTESLSLIKIYIDDKYQEAPNFKIEEPISIADAGITDNISYSDSYIFNGAQYEMVNPKTCKYSECYSRLIGKYVVGDIDFPFGTEIRKIENTSPEIIQYSYKDIFDGEIVKDSYSGIYKTEDDYGDSYYYRGNITNNYVKFANRYWKILRVNGDGSIRMILSNIDESQQSDKFINGGKNIIFNEKTDDIKYIGYMFWGSTEDALSTSIEDAFENKFSSNIKKELDNWYIENLSTHSKYISDNLFCNDREMEYNDETGGSAFKSNKRLTNHIPSLKCSQQNDRFTVNDEKIGNGDLTYPIGIVSADELIIAGVSLYSNLSIPWEENFLHEYTWMFTLTPASKTGGRYITNSNWMTINNYNNNSAYVSPVINIKPEYALKVIGSGTMTDPFMIPGVN